MSEKRVAYIDFSGTIMMVDGNRWVDVPTFLSSMGSIEDTCRTYITGRTLEELIGLFANFKRHFVSADEVTFLIDGTRYANVSVLRYALSRADLLLSKEVELVEPRVRVLRNYFIAPLTGLLDFIDSVQKPTGIHLSPVKEIRL